MAGLKKYDITGKHIGELSIDDEILHSETNHQMIKDYIVALRANARQWSANTKGRSEVNVTKKKPFPQKGTGNARQGFLGAPQFRGGGVVFGPKPKFDQHVRINKKERRAAIRQLLVEKINNGSLVVLKNHEFDGPKTKIVAQFLKSLNFAGKTVLFLGEGYFEMDKEGRVTDEFTSPSEKYQPFIMSMRNIPNTRFKLVPNINGYDVLVNNTIVVMESALDELMVALRG